MFNKQKKLAMSLGSFVKYTLIAVPASIALIVAPEVARNYKQLWYESSNIYKCSFSDDVDIVLGACSRAIEFLPSAMSYYLRAEIYEQKQERDRAIADFSEAIRLALKDPFFAGLYLADAYFERGVVYAEKGERDRAISDFSEAVRLNPDATDAYSARGRAHIDKGEYDTAIADLNEAIRLDSKSALKYFLRAGAYLDKGSYERAIADYGAALHVDPNFADAHFNRGIAYEKIDEMRAALSDYRKFVELAPRDPDGPVAVARLEAKLAQTPSPPAGGPSEKRVALLIGVSDYAAVPRLPNPKRDAEGIAEALREKGFETQLLANPTRAELVAALQSFQAKVDAADWGLVYFAGHGMEIGGKNYLLPKDARMESDRNADDEAVTLARVERAVQGAKKLRLVLLDACRNNPFLAQMKRAGDLVRAVDRGLAPIQPDPGTLVVYATKDGETANDGDGAHSPFATAFMKEIQRPGLEVRRLFDYVRDDVLAATGKRQQPFSYGSLPAREDFYFSAAQK